MSLKSVIETIGEKVENVFSKKNPVVVIVQCRLSSTRLPRKALLPIGEKTILEYALSAMKKVKADRYFLATDVDSQRELEPIAKKNKWELYAGSQLDVLKRFCDVIELTNACTVVRATADNPFLFYDAANELLEKFLEENKTKNIDYMTFSGLPHGSGIEIFKGSSLLKSISLTDSQYDHEHVGPALYNHKENFICEFIPAPKKYNFPNLRTTVDTECDYRRALRIVDCLKETHKKNECYTSEEIIESFNLNCVSNQILFVPSILKGHGTGHLRRCLSLACKLNSDIFIPQIEDSIEIAKIISEYREKGLKDFQIVRNLKSIEGYSLCVADYFKMPKDLYETLSSQIPVLSIDDGAEDTENADYLLNIIPSLDDDSCVNFTEHKFIALPKNKREEQGAIHNALVCIGGEDPCNLTLPASIALASCGIYVCAVCKNESTVEECKNKISDELSKYIKFVLPIENLKETLFNYDLVVTHFGFTAFEACSANCAVVLLATSELHLRLSKKHGFKVLPQTEITKENFNLLLKNQSELYNSMFKDDDISLSEFVEELSLGNHYECPICYNEVPKFSGSKNPIVARTQFRTFRRCKNCSMIYIAFSRLHKETEYNHSYFFEDYQKQYGKTYLEDFNSIKMQCIRRVSVIDFLYRMIHHHTKVTLQVLDVGCAMGPFLDAANDSGAQVFGLDVCQEAVDYVQNALSFPAVCSDFCNFNPESAFGVTKFDVITMWYVIEHFKNLDEVLKYASSILKPKGIFAFSTPSASGVSAKYFKKKFFEQSPQDHYSVWEIKNAKNILKKYGFKILKIVPTGIHPERFPEMQNLKKELNKKSLRYRLLKLKSKILKLGDTIEIYCEKI